MLTRFDLVSFSLDRFRTYPFGAQYFLPRGKFQIQHLIIYSPLKHPSKCVRDIGLSPLGGVSSRCGRAKGKREDTEQNRRQKRLVHYAPIVHILNFELRQWLPFTWMTTCHCEQLEFLLDLLFWIALTIGEDALKRVGIMNTRVNTKIYSHAGGRIAAQRRCSGLSLAGYSNRMGQVKYLLDHVASSPSRLS